MSKDKDKKTGYEKFDKSMDKLFGKKKEGLRAEPPKDKGADKGKVSRKDLDR